MPRVPITTTIGLKMAMSKKQVKTKIRHLLNTKREINQPGRLTSHIMNEIGLISKNSSGSQVRALVEQALDELETEGIVTLKKSGRIFDGVKRTSRQRAVSGSKRQSSFEAKPCGTTPVLKSSSVPNYTFERKDSVQLPQFSLERLEQTLSTNAAIKEEASTIEVTAATVEVPSATKPEGNQDENQDNSNRGIQIIRETLELAEKYKRLHESEAKAHKDMTLELARIRTKNSSLLARNSQLEEKIGELEKGAKNLENKIESLELELVKATSRATQLNKEAEQLKIALSEAKKRSDIDELALRLDQLRSTETPSFA